MGWRTIDDIRRENVAGLKSVEIIQKASRMLAGDLPDNWRSMQALVRQAEQMSCPPVVDDDRKAKTAKNKRRSRARWRRRELRRSGGSTELSAAALPAPAPSFGSSEAGEPGAEADYPPRCPIHYTFVLNLRTRVCTCNFIGCDWRSSLDDPDGPPDPLPAPVVREERSFVPNKFGEHD